MIIVDTSPLSAFLRSGRIGLLRALLGDIHIPGAVAEELDRGQRLVGAWRAALPNAIVHQVPRTPLLTLILEEVHAGEAECIALAVEHRGKLVIDEIRGRQVAQRLGVPVAGSAGLVAAAKRKGLIPEARSVLSDLRSKGGLWLSEQLCKEVLAALGEG